MQLHLVMGCLAAISRCRPQDVRCHRRDGGWKPQTKVIIPSPTDLIACVLRLRIEVIFGSGWRNLRREWAIRLIAYGRTTLGRDLAMSQLGSVGEAVGDS